MVGQGMCHLITFFCGCIGPFRKQPEPKPVSQPIVIESPTISINWPLPISEISQKDLDLPYLNLDEL